MQLNRLSAFNVDITGVLGPVYFVHRLNLTLVSESQIFTSLPLLANVSAKDTANTSGLELQS